MNKLQKSHEHYTDLMLIKTTADFIRQNLMSSDKAEYEFKELIVEDIFSLIHKVNDYATWGSEPINVNGLPVKVFGHNVYRKEDLLYRIDEILALVNSLSHE